MKLLKRNKNMEVHRRRYIKLTIVLFIIAFLFNMWQFIVVWDSAIGNTVVLPITGMLTMFISGAMAFMGAFYLLKK